MLSRGVGFRAVWIARFVCVVVLLSCGSILLQPAWAESPRIAAAASLNYVMEQIRDAYLRETGQTVDMIFGSSHNLAHQIIAGAPFDVFLSADRDAIELLQTRFMTQGKPVQYGIGRLALFISMESELSLSTDFSSLSGLTRPDSLWHMAIANPEIAPYGRAAHEALRNSGRLDELRPHLVIGLNAMQAAQFVISGSVETAIIPYILARNPLFEGKGRYLRVADELYHCLRHEMVLVHGAEDQARAFFEFLKTDSTHAIFISHGL